MTDRQMLEAAARAAGLKIDLSSRNGAPSSNDGFNIRGNVVLDWHNGVNWNPLTDDGDALRLAVKLGLAVVPYAADVAALHNASGRSWAEMRGSDPCAATRRAIVRAAAALDRGHE